MLIKTIVTLLIMAGLFVIFRINPFAPLAKLRHWKPNEVEKKKKQTAKQFVDELDGKKKENLVQRNLNETKHSLTIIGQSKMYSRTVKFAVLTGIAGGAVGLVVFSSIILMLVLGIGCALLPLWFTKLSVYSYSKHVNSELETALSMVTTSYTRHNNLTKAIEETMSHARAPVKEIFQRYLNSVLYVNPNTEKAIRQMKYDLDNTIFHQWCDILILCQSDHSIKAGLYPIVEKLSDLKSQQAENETQMMMPLREILTMVGIVVGVVPLLRVISPDWYYYLIHTFAGQITMAINAVIIFASINKAIKLSKPIDYRL